MLLFLNQDLTFVSRVNDTSAMATMKYKDMFVMSPNSKNNKLMKKKKEAQKKKDQLGSSKMMKSGSTSAMFHNNSISDSYSKKSLTRQKTSGVLKTIPYSVSQNLLGSTLTTSSPTIEMFNSIINSQKNLKQRKKTTSRKKHRDTITPNSYSKFRNTFLSMYDYNSPTTASGSTNSGPITTSAALKKMLSVPKHNSHMHDVNTVSINSCNGKPLMIKVGNDNKGLIEYNNYLRQTSKTPLNVDAKQDIFDILEKNQRQNDEFHQAPPFVQELGILKAKFTKVLNDYKNREQILRDRCSYLEAELRKAQENAQ